MKRLFWSLVINGASLYIVEWLFGAFYPGRFVIGSASALIMAAIVLGVLNATVKPVLKLLTLPITVLTLGLSLLLINAIILQITDFFVTGFTLVGFWPSLAVAILFSIVNSALTSVFND